MGEKVDVEDLVDAATVAELLGLAQPNSVLTYLARYADMPRPLVDLGPRRVKLWSRQAVIEWKRTRFHD